MIVTIPMVMVALNDGATRSSWNVLAGRFVALERGCGHGPHHDNQRTRFGDADSNDGYRAESS
jgi:hypothetical protein